MMLIPKPFQDELSYGHVGRISYLNDLESIQVVVHLLRRMSRRTRKNVPWLSYVADACRYSEEEYARQHTMGPLLKTVLRTPRTSHDPPLLEAMLRSVVPLTRCLSGAYCPACVREDTCRYGVAYWHRIHHIPGVRWCLKHETSLWLDERPRWFLFAPEDRDEGAVHPVSQKGNSLVKRYASLMQHFLGGVNGVILQEAREAVMEHLAKWPRRTPVSCGYGQALGLAPALPPPWDFVRLWHIGSEEAASLDQNTEELFRQASAYNVGAYGLALAIVFSTIEEAADFHSNIKKKPAAVDRHVEGVVDDVFWGTPKAPRSSKHTRFAASVSAAAANQAPGKSRLDPMRDEAEAIELDGVFLIDN